MATTTNDLVVNDGWPVVGVMAQVKTQCFCSANERQRACHDGSDGSAAARFVGYFSIQTPEEHHYGVAS